MIPTNFTVRARGRVDLAIKNLSTNLPVLGYSYSGPGGGGSSSGLAGIIPPFYGFSTGFHWGPTGGGGGGGELLYPTNWPVTLPPGMTEREAKTHDFSKDLAQLQLNDLLPRLAQNPRDHHVLLAVGRLNFALKNNAAAEEVFSRFFASDCKDKFVLNSAAYEYVECSGTNIERAYELALQSLELDPSDSNTIDTVGWIQLKRGYYREALSLLIRGNQRFSGDVKVFHIGMAHYMLKEEELARLEFLKVIQSKRQFREKTEAEKCLAVLDLKTPSRISSTVTKLVARLSEAPDDPVALDRLGSLFEPAGTGRDRPPQDSLTLKAAGMHAFRREDYARAAECLGNSTKTRTTDAELFFYLGMAQNRLNQKRECADSLRKALGIGLKAARAQEANEVLATASDLHEQQ